MRASDCIVTISFGYILYCVCFTQYCVCFNLYCGCFNLFCNSVGVCMCRCFDKMRTYIYFVLYCLYCFFILFHLCIFILIYFVCTSVRTTATE